MCGDGGEDGDLDEDLAADRCAEEDESAKAPELEVSGHGEQAIAVLAVGPPEDREEDAREVVTGDGGGDGCAGDTVAGEREQGPVVGEEQEPVAEYVDEVGGGRARWRWGGRG